MKAGNTGGKSGWLMSESAESEAGRKERHKGVSPIGGNRKGQKSRFQTDKGV